MIFQSRKSLYIMYGNSSRYVRTLSSGLGQFGKRFLNLSKQFWIATQAPRLQNQQRKGRCEAICGLRARELTSITNTTASPSTMRIAMICSKDFTSCNRAASFMRIAQSAAFLYRESSMYSSKRSSASVMRSMYFSVSANGNLYLQGYPCKTAH
jgi:hypothetical protein